MLTRIHCKLPFRCRYTGVFFVWPLSIVGTLLALISSPSSPTTVSWIYCRAFSPNQEIQRRGFCLSLERTVPRYPSWTSGYIQRPWRSSLSDRGRWEEITLGQYIYVCYHVRAHWIRAFLLVHLDSFYRNKRDHMVLVFPSFSRSSPRASPISYDRRTKDNY